MHHITLVFFTSTCFRDAVLGCLWFLSNTRGTSITTNLHTQTMTAAPALASNMIKCVKDLSELPQLKTIPSSYVYNANPTTTSESSFASDAQDSLPVIDFSLLTCSNTDQRSKVIEDLGKACQDWGFFMVVNHGIPENLMKSMINACNEFFNMPEEEKLQNDGKHVLDPIRCGTSFNVSVEKVFFWRDFLKVFVHPQFHCPLKPPLLREVLSEYCGRSRAVATELLKGVSESLGLEDSYMQKALNMESGLQIFIANYYPPCPQPQLAMGMPSHSDHGLLTFLIENDVGGLQIQHNGKWFNINAIPNAILVNVGDHLEIISNGKYKSVLHRAVVNNKVTRISLALANGPSLDTIVGPATQLVQAAQSNNRNPPAAAYIPIKYKDYLELQQSNQLQEKSCLDRVRKQVNE